jgi:glycopeptide antibiotics resistance protein
VLFNKPQRRADHPRWHPDLALVLLVLWGLFIVYATTLPFDFSASGELVARRLRNLWQHPLKGGSWSDVASNVLFFLPWGFFLAAWKARHGWSFAATLILALVSGCVLSGCVELSQLPAAHRSMSFIDVVTNTFGATVGALIAWPLICWAWPVLAVRLRHFVVWRPLTACSLCIVAGLLLAGITPFRVRLRPDDLKQAIRDARLVPFGPTTARPDPRSSPWIWVRELCTWILVGGLFVAAAREAGRHETHAKVIATAAAAGLSLVIQVLHMLIREREFDMTFVLCAIVGSALGAALFARRTSEQPRRVIIPALSIWGLAVLLSAWVPLRFAWPDPPYWRTEWIVPFWTYFYSRSLDDIADVLIQALSFAPLGALLAARSWRQSLLGVMLVGLGIGAFLEIGQVFLPHRTADITDALAAAAGAATGWGLWRWGESFRSSSSGNVKYRVAPASGLKG